MRRRFSTIRDYHDKAPEIRVQHADFGSVKASLLTEHSGDVQFAETDRNGIVLTLDGSATHLTRMAGINDESPSNPGEICLIPHGLDVHLAWTNHAEFQKSLMLEFDDTLFTAFAPEVLSDAFTRGHLVPANFSSRPELAYLIRLIGREIDGSQNRGRLFVESAIRLFALEVAASAWSTPTKIMAGRGDLDARVHRAIAYIEEHFYHDISLQEIGSAAGVSVTHLSGIFQRQTGATPYSYVINRRLRHAIHLLRTSNMPIAQVALESGFSDQQHMTRAFRSRAHKTPKAIRTER